MAKKHFILGVHITNRVKRVPDVQATLTQFGCHIRTRIGLHDADGRSCATCGLLILDLVGDEKKCNALAKKLARIEGIEVKKMVFK